MVDGVAGKALRYLHAFGLRATVARTFEKLMELGGLRRPERRVLPVSSEKLLIALARDGEVGHGGHALVDIVVPVFNGFDLLQRCTESLLRNSEGCRMHFVNDASTDTRVASYLRSLVVDASCGVTIDYVENETNLGFVATVNRGLRMATHDVVILNTDTEVPPRWLERIMAPVAADPDHVASVTPMSNAATLFSFPEIWNDNTPFLGKGTDLIDGYFERYGQRDPVDAPSGVGFCMLMSRAALEAVGVFDEETFGRGYGEENDWCMRAQRRGFRNLVTPNLYVYHHHGGSFESEEKIALQTKHQLVLRKRYPELFLQNESFSERDPLSCTRLAIALKMASNNEPHGPFLMMDVDVPAGVPSGAVAYRDWLARSLSKRGKTVIILTYDPGQAVMRVRVSSPPTPEPRVVGVVSGDLENRIADLVDLLAPKRILVTNLVWYPHPESSAAEVRASEVPYLVFAHDFCSICPSWFLINKDGTYCGGETQTDVCDRCLPQNSYADYRSVYPEFSPSIMRWRSSMKQLLDGAQAVVCFSQSTLDVLNRVFGLLRGVVIPHVVAAPEEEGVRSERVLDGVLAVAVIGSMQHIKGVDVVRGLVTAVRRARLPIRFVVIGSWPGYADHFSSVDHRLRVTGAYRREDLPRLLEESGASLVMIPSIWPETFSYTTSEAILLGYPVVCFDLGAPAERVRTYDCGMVVEDISAEGMIGALKHILDHPDLIEYWSRNTARYSPPTEAEHIDAILRCLGESSHRGDNRLVDTQEATS